MSEGDTRAVVETLIAAIMARPLLYNPAAKDHRNLSKTSVVWKQILEYLQRLYSPEILTKARLTNVRDIKEKFHGLRSSYRRHKNQMKDPLEGDAEEMKKPMWRWFNQMSFLDADPDLLHHEINSTGTVMSLDDTTFTVEDEERLSHVSDNNSLVIAEEDDTRDYKSTEEKEMITPTPPTANTTTAEAHFTSSSKRKAVSGELYSMDGSIRQKKLKVEPLEISQKSQLLYESVPSQVKLLQ